MDAGCLIELVRAMNKDLEALVDMIDAFGRVQSQSKRIDEGGAVNLILEKQLGSCKEDMEAITKQAAIIMSKSNILDKFSNSDIESMLKEVLKGVSFFDTICKEISQVLQNADTNETVRGQLELMTRSLTLMWNLLATKNSQFQVAKSNYASKPAEQQQQQSATVRQNNVPRVLHSSARPAPHAAAAYQEGMQAILQINGMTMEQANKFAYKFSQAKPTLYPYPGRMMENCKSNVNKWFIYQATEGDVTKNVQGNGTFQEKASQYIRKWLGMVNDIVEKNLPRNLMLRLEKDGGPRPYYLMQCLDSSTGLEGITMLCNVEVGTNAIVFRCMVPIAMGGQKAVALASRCCARCGKDLW